MKKLQCAGFNCDILTEAAREEWCGECICQQWLEQADAKAREKRRRNREKISPRRYIEIYGSRLIVKTIS